MSEQIDWDRLARYVSGEATAGEAEAVRQWAASSTERQGVLASLERRWRAAAPTASFNVDAAWQRMAPRLGAAKGVRELSLIRTARVVVRPWMVALAATLVLAVGLSTRWIGRDDVVPSAGRPFAGVEARTAVGERRTIELPDSSVVVLGVHSTLQFEPSPAGAPRIVRLEGEAFFTVQHDPARPFRVLASNVVTEDVGTEFSVRAYAGEERVRVAVREGAVSLTRGGGLGTGGVILLGKHDVATVAADGPPEVTSDTAVERLFAWTDGDLVFDDASLAEVAAELSRWYDVEFRFADPEAAARHLTSTLKSDPIDEVLRVIGLSAEVRFERRGRVVTVYAAPRTSTGDHSPSRVAPRGTNVAENEEEGGV